MKRHHIVIATSTLVGVAIAVAIVLRPTRTIPVGPELRAPEHIAPDARAQVKARMQRHGERLLTLVSQVVLLDYDHAARTAGEIFDSPGVARPPAGDDLAGLLPERFFVMQDGLRAHAKQVVEAAARRDAVQFSQAAGALMNDCVACHDLYLHTPAH